MKTVLIVLIVLTVVVLFLYWYAGYSSRSGFAVDENKNNVPDAWENKLGWFFKARNFIILLLGMLIGYSLAMVIHSL